MTSKKTAIVAAMMLITTTLIIPAYAQQTKDTAQSEKLLKKQPEQGGTGAGKAGLVERGTIKTPKEDGAQQGQTSGPKTQPRIPENFQPEGTGTKTGESGPTTQPRIPENFEPEKTGKQPGDERILPPKEAE